MKIHTIYDIDHACKEYPGVNLALLDSSSFYFNMGKRWLYIDSYGDDIMPGSCRQRIFGATGDSLAVCMETGELAITWFEEKNDISTMSVQTLKSWSSQFGPVAPKAYRVPGKFLPKLDNLYSRKRPWHLSIRETALFDFMDQSIGYRNLGEYLIVCLNFLPEETLEVWYDSYRICTCWQDDDAKSSFKAPPSKPSSAEVPKRKRSKPNPAG